MTHLQNLHSITFILMITAAKHRIFLKTTDFRLPKEREYNKKYYGVQGESKRILDLFKEKAKGILNPDLLDDTDRAFLSGLLGKEEEENNYKKRISSSNRALSELQDAFRGSQFEGELKPAVQRFNSTPTITTAVNRNTKNEIKHAIADPNKALTIGKYAKKEEKPASRKSLKDTLIDFFNNASSWANEKGFFDDITNAFFKASDLSQDYPLKITPTDITHHILA